MPMHRLGQTYCGYIDSAQILKLAARCCNVARTLTSGVVLNAVCLIVALLLVISGTTGCWFVDNFSNRAVAYNLEAEKAQDKGILLNIIRASKRRPMVFTGVQTVAGTASQTEGFSVTWPGGQNAVTSAVVLNPLASVSGGPTFNVGVLDTQEFYNGMLRALEPATFDRFFQEGYSKELILNLFVEKIVIRQIESTYTNIIEFKNDVSTKDISTMDKFNEFQLLVEHLLSLGLTTEANENDVGPLISPEEAKNIKALAKAQTAKLELKQVDWCDITELEWREFLNHHISRESSSIRSLVCIEFVSKMHPKSRRGSE
jgi:hypothetical protein